MTFYEKLLKLCEREGTSPSAVAKEIGLSNSSATYWKRGSTPKYSTLKEIAEYFSTSVDYLIDTDANLPDPPKNSISFNTTPDPEWLEFEALKKKQENGTITHEEMNRAGELFKLFTKRNAESLKQFQEKIDAFTDSFKQQIINQQSDVLPIMLENLKSMASLISDLTPPKSESVAQQHSEALTEVQKPKRKDDFSDTPPDSFSQNAPGRSPEHGGD